MTLRVQRRSLMVYMVLVAAFAVVLVTQCSRNWDRAQLVEQFDNGPLLPGPDGKPQLNPGPSEGYRWVGHDESPPPGKHWRKVDPNELSPEQRAQIR